MQRSTPSSWDPATGPAFPPSGAVVPVAPRVGRRPALLTPAARKALRQRMLLYRQASLDRISALTGRGDADLKRFRSDLAGSTIPDTLLQRGAGLPFTRELPQGALLYLLVRALSPRRIVETGVRPGYSTAWLLAGLEANGAGELVSLGPGSSRGRAAGIADGLVGEFVAPSLRGRWTLVLGNTEERLQEIVQQAPIDLFFYDNGPDANRARYELRAAWPALSERGVIVAHRIEANAAWSDFCRLQGLPAQVLDPGPPAMGALAVRPPTPASR